MRTFLSRLLKSLILLSLIVILPISCSKDIHKGDLNGDLSESEVHFERVKYELLEYLNTNEIVTIEEFKLFLEKYSESITTETRNDILYILIDSTYELLCDINGITYPLYENNGEVSDTESILSEIDEDLNLGNNKGTTRCFGDPYVINTSSSTRVFSNDEKVIINPLFLIWHPWEEIVPGNGWPFYLNANNGMQAIHTGMSSDGHKFGVINIRCHGTPEGYMLIPNEQSIKEQIEALGMIRATRNNGQNDDISLHGDYIEGAVPFPVIENGEPVIEDGRVKIKYMPAFVLLENGMRKLFPQDLSRSIVWMNMCFSASQNSAVKNILEEKNVAAFAGASSRSAPAISDEDLKTFVTLLFNKRAPMSAKNAAKEALVGSKKQWFRNVIYKAYEYHSQIYNEDVNGYYSFYYYGKDISCKPYLVALSAIDDLPRADMIMPSEWYESEITSRGLKDTTRESSADGMSVGFWIKNKETKEVQEIVFSNSSIRKHENGHNPYYYPKDDNLPKEIVRIEVLGVTDSLAPGTYEYRTYLEIDGEKEYSDSTYEFTVMDIKHLSCPDYNHPHLIDLGLPSGTKWLCCNLGVNNLVNTGYYFSWGVTMPYDSNDYQLMHYPRFYYPYSECHGFSDLDLAYQGDGDIYTDIGSNISATAYDAAYSRNKLIRLPTKEEFEELIDSCIFLIGPVCISDGISSNVIYSGSVAIGPNGNMIALPIANYWTGTLSKEEEKGGALLAYPRVNGVSGSAYCFIGDDVNYTSAYLDENVKLLLHYIKDDKDDPNLYYFIGSKFYIPSIAPQKRFHPYYIRPVGR